MRWVHDLDAFDRLPVAEQERVIGRTKADSVELSDDEKPPTAHIARVTIEDDGEELELFRRSVPYGDGRGVRPVLRRVQRRPVALRPHARAHVRMTATACTTASPTSRAPVSGAYYFAPSLNDLREMAGPEDD